MVLLKVAVDVNTNTFFGKRFYLSPAPHRDVALHRIHSFLSGVFNVKIENFLVYCRDTDIIDK